MRDARGRIANIVGFYTDLSARRESEERLRYLRELDDRRSSILASIEEQGKLTPELAREMELKSVSVPVANQVQHLRFDGARISALDLKVNQA